MIYFQIATTLIMSFAIMFLLAWVIRPGSSDKYKSYSKIPLDND